MQHADDPSGEWFRECIGRLTASTFGRICKHKSKHDVLIKQLLYCKPRETKEMRYGRYHEVEAREQYLDRLKKKHTDATVIITGLHVDLAIMRNFCVCIYEYKNIITTKVPWLAASPDGLVNDPSTNDTEGLVEIKCPARAKDILLMALATKKSYNFYLKETNGRLSLKRNHDYYYQISLS